MAGEKLDITKEEMKTLTEAMKKEEFRKLLMDYAEELADPEKRKLYEEELAQLESQRGVDMRFIKPDPGFVLKTTDSANAKVFINICSSGEIAKPDMQPAEQKKGDRVERGQQCSLPYSLSPCHKEADNKGAECEVYDVVFNPETLRLCSNPAFKNMVVNSALDGVIGNFKVSLNRDEVKFPKMKFKGTPAQCVIRKRVDEEQPDAFAHLPKRPDFPDLPGEKPKGSKKPAKPQPSKPSNEPDYKIVYRDEVNMGNFVNERVSSGGRPTQLVITISLPKHGSAREVDLDVYSDSLDLKSEHYVLNIRIPYEVDSERGKARFDKSKKELVVTLDVVPQVINEGGDLIEFLRSQGAPDSSLVQEVEAGPSHQSESTETAQQAETLEPTQQSDPGKVESVADPIVKPEPGPAKPDPATVEPPEPEPMADSEPIEFTDYSEVLKSVETEIKRLSLKEQESKKSAEADKPALIQELESEMPESVEETQTEDSGEMADVETNSDISSIEIIPSDISDHSEQSSDKAETYPAVSDTSDFVKVDLPSAGSPDMPAKLSDINLLTVQDQPAASNPRSRFNVSPVPCTEDPSTKKRNEQEQEPQEPEDQDEGDDELFVLDDMNSVNSPSFLIDCAGDNNLSVSIRVYQDMSTATVLLDTTFNSVPEVTHSGKKVWLRNEDVSLYLLLPHSITTFTIDMSVDNVCFVVYKQHKALWSALHIGHSEEEVYSYKFLTEDNTDHLVDLFGDPWVDLQECHVTSQVVQGDQDTTISYTVGNKPTSLPIYSPDPDGEDPSIKGILKSPHSPPPVSPRSRKVSFNEEVETFVLPSKRSLKGKKRRKKGSGSSNSESSDDASSPTASSPIQSFSPPNRAATEESSVTQGLILDSASSDQSSGSCGGQGKKNGKKNKKKSGGKGNNAVDKENVLQTQSEVVKCLDPSGSATHRMSLGNSHIYELED